MKSPIKKSHSSPATAIPRLDTYFFLWCSRSVSFLMLSSFPPPLLFSPLLTKSLLMDYLTFKEDNDLLFCFLFPFSTFISSSRMTSNQLGASTILQPLPNSLGKNQCKFDFLSYFVLLQFNLQLPSDLGDLFIVFGLLLIVVRLQ